LIQRCWIGIGFLALIVCAKAATPAAIDTATAPTATAPTAGAPTAGAPTAGPTLHGAPSPPSLTIQELMDTRIDPSADVLWDSVAFIASMKGEEDRRPRTPAEWEAVRRSALALIESVNELSLPGRRVASIDKPPGRGELRASAIQRRIDANPRAFARHARVLGTAAQQALSAIDAKDAEALMNAGGVIDEACESCHVVYWYPHQARSGP
jgi:cytochrome c556